MISTPCPGRESAAWYGAPIQRGASGYRDGIRSKRAGRGGLWLSGQLVSAGDRKMRAIGAALTVIWLLLALPPATPVAAQEPTGTSYITPFPEGDVYKLQA